MHLKLPLFKRETPGERDRKVLREALDRLAGADDAGRLDALAGVLRVLRPKDSDDAVTAERRVRALTLLVSSDETHRDALRVCLLQLLTEKQWVHLLTDTGILPGETLSNGLWRRIGLKLLPEVANEQWLSHVLGRLFPRADDYRWVRHVPDEVWSALLDELDFGAMPMDKHRTPLLLQFLQALQVVAHRIAAIGLEPELVRNHPAIEKYESPFLAQSEETRQFIRERQQALADDRAPTLDDRHLLVLLDQCTEIVTKIRRQAEKSGASISLTTLLLRLDQSLLRMRTLLTLLEDRPAHELNTVRVQMFKRLVRGVNRRNSLAELWSQYMSLLAQRIAGNAGKTGEQYITTTRSEYAGLFRSALGAGLVVALAAFIKLSLSGEPHAPLVEAFLYSLNYAWCFMLMSAMHWTLATKQPAMTANRIAHSMDSDEPTRQRRLEGLAELIVCTSRSQFIALTGNLVVTVPVAIGLGYVVLAQTGGQYISPEKAAQLLSEADPLNPRNWLWGALTGVWLFVCGLVSGYYDNKTVYDRIPERVAQLRWLRRLAGDGGAQRVAGYIGDHLGALMGSLFFGILLGSTAAAGKIVGLPLDTLHVTFVSANTSYALVALDWEQSAGGFLRLAAGVGAVGTMNLVISFGLALFVSLRAREVEFSETRRLMALLRRRLWQTPRDWLWPPRKPGQQPAQS